MLNLVKKSLLATTASIILALPVYAGSKFCPTELTGVDTLLTTIVTKSAISGALAKQDGYLQMDANGNFMFDYAGDVTTVILDKHSGVVKGLSEPIGTVTGQAAFPQEFAGLAFGVYGWIMGGMVDPMPAIPAKIDWACNDCTLVIDGTTYKSTAGMDAMMPGATEMAMAATAYTGMGPVEIGTLLNGDNGLSMSVRTGGCGAVVGVDGPNAGKVGTLCMNGTFTFDLSGIVLSADPMEMMTSDLKGTGNSNCVLVLQDPMAM